MISLTFYKIFRWPTRNRNKTRSWGAFLFRKRVGVLCMSYIVYLISYFAAGDSLRSDTPHKQKRKNS